MSGRRLILKKVAPEFNYLQLKDGIVFALNQCLERGVTTVHDIVRYGRTCARLPRDSTRKGRMHARVSILPRVIESDIEFAQALIDLGLIRASATSGCDRRRQDEYRRRYHRSQCLFSRAL